MTKKTFFPYLFIREVKIFSNAKLAYGASFHDGVNIIRGENSSGKSTVMNFLLYGLGGNFSRWVPEAKNCDVIFSEIEVNGVIITLKRELEDSKAKPISIYWGAMVDALGNDAKWELYPLSRTEKVESFSQVLFRILGFPEVKTEDESNITIHQVLRLLFVDQISQPYSLMIEEKFDSPLTRQAIGDLLIGTYDNELYSDQLLERKTAKELFELEAQHKYLVQVLMETGQYSLLIEAERAIGNIISSLKEIDLEIKKVSVTRLGSKPSKTVSILVDQIKNQRVALGDRFIELHKLEYDILDSGQFLSVLMLRLKTLDESLLARKLIEELPIKICPHCLSSLAREVVAGHCNLCTQELPSPNEPVQVMRMRQELEFQIKESIFLLSRKEVAVEKLRNQLPTLKSSLNQSQKRFDLYSTSIQSTSDLRIEELLIKKGALEKELEYSNKHLVLMRSLQTLRNNIGDRKKLISELGLKIKIKKMAQVERSNLAFSSIKKYALELLKADGEYEQAFAEASDVSISFKAASVFVDGRGNFSASSVTYLKNATLYSIFFSSLEEAYFRYPRLILCDNMEDKGMTEQRSKNLQRNIVRLSESFDVRHQIIFSTSMIADELNNNFYCIGPYYLPTSKTLKLSNHNA